MNESATLPGVLRLVGSLAPLRRVLLLNPPVHETNYRWLQWNQPMDLLKLGSWLRDESGADVRLYDFLAPEKSGKPPRHKLERQWDIHGVATDAWHFGRPYEALRRTLTQWARREEWIPDVILIGTLTSYWVAGVYGVVSALRNLGNAYRDVPIALLGNLPRYAPKRAASIPGVTHRATYEGFPVESSSALDLYEQTGTKATFCALDACNPQLVSEVRTHIARGVLSFTFFNEDIFGANSQIEALAESEVVNPKRISFDIICGARPAQLSEPRLRLLGRLGVRTMCVDYEVDEAGELLVEHYERLRGFTLRENFLRREGSLTGFVNFGLPNESFDRIVYHTLLLNKWMGSIILKPFGALVERHSEADCSRRWPRPEDQSPHAFPYLRDGETTVEDYLNLYRWQALLNYKNRGATFDFLADTALGRTVRASVVGESWTLESIIKEGERAAANRKANRAALPPASV